MVCCIVLVGDSNERCCDLELDLSVRRVAFRSCSSPVKMTSFKSCGILTCVATPSVVGSYNQCLSWEIFGSVPLSAWPVSNTPIGLTLHFLLKPRHLSLWSECYSTSVLGLVNLDRVADGKCDDTIDHSNKTCRSKAAARKHCVNSFPLTGLSLKFCVPR